MATVLQTAIQDSIDTLTPAQRKKLQGAAAKEAGDILQSQVDFGTLIFTCLTPAQLEHFSANLLEVKRALSPDSRKVMKTPEHVDDRLKNFKVASLRAGFYKPLVGAIVMEVSNQFTEAEVQKYLDQKDEIPALVAQWFAI